MKTGRHKDILKKDNDAVFSATDNQEKDTEEISPLDNQYAEYLVNWIKLNSDKVSGLPFSHIGDPRFVNWTITYDAAVVTIAYIAAGEIDSAERIINFYIETNAVKRLGGMIEAFVSDSNFIGKDWSVRSGANIWLGIACFHLYKATGKEQYLDYSKGIAGFVISLQNTNVDDDNYQGVCLGPRGNPAYPADQYIAYDIKNPSFEQIYPVEVNIDSYALFNLLYKETREKEYLKARDGVFNWIKRVGYNRELRRFNRGAGDSLVASDVHSWSVSALGVDGLGEIERGLSDRVVEFIERRCMSEVKYEKPEGEVVHIKGIDFIDKDRAKFLGRDPLVSAEWTFQFINAYRRMERDFIRLGNYEKADIYKYKRRELLSSIMKMAIENNNTLSFAYATKGNAIIGHEYNTPYDGNMSVIGVAYGILALMKYDPLYYE